MDKLTEKQFGALFFYMVMTVSQILERKRTVEEWILKLTEWQRWGINCVD